jgi:hypothetical protein
MHDSNHHPAYYRDTAATLRKIAKSCVDLCRQSQLQALAAGFERFADRIERGQARPEAAD